MFLKSPGIFEKAHLDLPGLDSFPGLVRLGWGFKELDGLVVVMGLHKDVRN